MELMKNMKRIALVFIQIIFLISCSSLDGDARKAAELNNESLRYAADDKLEDSEEAYRKSQEIIDEYRDSQNFEEFFKLYVKYSSSMQGVEVE